MVYLGAFQKQSWTNVLFICYVQYIASKLKIAFCSNIVGHATPHSSHLEQRSMLLSAAETGMWLLEFD